VAWRPQPGPQTLLLQCPPSIRDPNGECDEKTGAVIERVVETFFGGARGGGKTSGILGHWTKHAARWGKRARGILFRKTNDELEEVKEQADALFPKLGAIYQVGKRMWVFPNKASLRFRVLEHDKDADKYQGRQYSWQGWEELTNWASPVPIDKVGASLRSARGVLCQWVGTGNPGGPGHNWVKARFINPARALTPIWDPVKKVWRVFIPSKLSDNRILVENDPGYADRLKGAGPEWLVRAWLDGNWDIVAGGMFDDVWDPAVHVIVPFPIPRNWPVIRSFDWGSSRPFSLGWWAIANGESVTLTDGRQLFFHKGTYIRVGEWYGWDGKEANKGLNMVDTEIARRGLALERDMAKAHGITVAEGPADPSIFTITNGQSIGTNMGTVGLRFIPAATGPGSRKSGWEAMRRRLEASKKMPSEEPGLFVFNSCQQFIRTVPMLPRDPKVIDDVDTDAEDHVGDETRYALTHVRRELIVKKLQGV
jgi:hypothetical protein